MNKSFSCPLDFPEIHGQPELEDQINRHFNAILSQQNRGGLNGTQKCLLKNEVAQFIVDCLFNQCGTNCTSRSECSAFQAAFNEQAFKTPELAIIAVCIFIFVAGVFGNGMTLWVLLWSGRWRKNTTNMFIVSLTLVQDFEQHSLAFSL